MSPALISEDVVLVDTANSSPPEKDDLVSIRFKQTPTPFVKRVIAVGDDLVEIKEDAIFVNGKRLRKIDTNRWQSTINQLRHYGWQIPKGNVFVLGDNPKNSRDSRRLGLISIDQIEGKVVEIIKKEK